MEEKFDFIATTVTGLEKKLARGKNTESGAGKRKRAMEDSGSMGYESCNHSREREKNRLPLAVLSMPPNITHATLLPQSDSKSKPDLATEEAKERSQSMKQKKSILILVQTKK